MASTNKTTNYELSQYVGSDKPTYLGDYNGDMLKIDTQMKANALAAATADSKATTAGTNASTALENAATADGKAVTAGETATSALSKATANETAIVALQTANTYSTTETVIGTYLNKPLYRKVVSTGTLPNGASSSSNWKEVAHGITNLGTIVNAYGSATDGSNILPLPFTSSGQVGENVRISFSDTYIFITCGTDRTSYTSSQIIIEYTKTTD